MHFCLVENSVENVEKALKTLSFYEKKQNV